MFLQHILFIFYQILWQLKLVDHFGASCALHPIFLSMEAMKTHTSLFLTERNLLDFCINFQDRNTFLSSSRNDLCRSGFKAGQLVLE